MTKREFLKHLEDAICSLPKAERKRHTDYYSELIDDMVEDGMQEQEAVEKLGDVQQIAAGILQDAPLPQKRPRNVAAIVLACVAGVLVLSLLALLIFVPVHRRTVIQDQNQVQQVNTPSTGTEPVVSKTAPATQPSAGQDVPPDTDKTRISASTPQNYQAFENEYAADGVYSIPVAEIRELKLLWLAGEAAIYPYDGEDILLQETADVPLTQAEALRYGIREGKLRIQYCAPGHYDELPVKQLEIYIPAALASALSKLEVESASAQIHVENLCIREADLETVSGDVDLQGTQAEDLDAETVSGRIQADGKFGVVDLSSTSGEVQLLARIQPRELDVETVSGPVCLQLPADSGFSLKFETSSGSIGGSLPLTPTGKVYQAGDGTRHYQVETVSGSVLVDILPD